MNAEEAIDSGRMDEAEIQINRASLLLNDFKDNIPITLCYKVSIF